METEETYDHHCTSSYEIPRCVHDDENETPERPEKTLRVTDSGDWTDGGLAQHLCLRHVILFLFQDRKANVCLVTPSSA